MSLDDKLKTVIANLDKGSVFGDYFDWDAFPEVLAQIKQAFLDDGYQRLEPGVTYMTGQSWYNRFKKELTQDMSTYADWTDAADIAAKRAAGLDDIDYQGGSRG